MKWFIHTASVLFVAAMLSGCGQESDQACAYDVQQNLDQGNWDAVISTLSNGGTCNGYLTKEQAQDNLAAAYLGKGGFVLSNLASLFEEAKKEFTKIEDINVTDPATLKKLAKLVDKYIGKKGEENLNKAKVIYQQIQKDSGVDCNTSNKSGRLVLACNMIKTVDGIAQGQQGSTLVTALGDDFDTFLESMDSNISYGPNDVNENNKSDKQDVLICNVADAKKDVNATTQIGICADKTITYKDEGEANFTKNGKTYTFWHRIFNVEDVRDPDVEGNKTFERLIDRNGTIVSPATLSGTCYLDFSENNCTLASNTSCYPCPVINDDGTTTTVADGLLAVINSDNTALFESLLPEDANLTQDENSTSSALVDYIRRENNDTNSTGPLTAEELAAALELFSK